MGAELTLRCVLEGILAVVLLHFGLVVEGLLAPVASLDPVIAPAAFYAANLLFLAGALAVGWPVLRDGLQGLKGRPSAGHHAGAGRLRCAGAGCGRPAQRPELSELQLDAAFRRGRTGPVPGPAGQPCPADCRQKRLRPRRPIPEGLQGAFRVRDKDLIRVLSRSLDQKDPWVLLSRPTEWDETLVEQCFGERASERRARKTALILLGAAVLSGLVFLLFGGGPNGMAAALTSMLCMGAPLSSTLVAGIASLRLQRPPPPPVPWCPAGRPLRSWAAWTPCRWMPTSSLPPTA